MQPNLQIAFPKSKKQQQQQQIKCYDKSYLLYIYQQWNRVIYKYIYIVYIYV